MKYLLIFFLPFCLLAQEQKLTEDPWLTDIDEAMKVAKKNDQNILVYFTGSDWCPPCKKLKTDLFDTKAFEKAAQNLVLVYVDIPRNKDLLSQRQLAHNTGLLNRYNPKKVFPVLKIVDSKGKELDEYSGYSMTGDVQYHLDFLAKHQK